VGRKGGPKGVGEAISKVIGYAPEKGRRLYWRQCGRGEKVLRTPALNSAPAGGPTQPGSGVPPILVCDHWGQLASLAGGSKS